LQVADQLVKFERAAALHWSPEIQRLDAFLPLQEFEDKAKSDKQRFDAEVAKVCAAV